MLELGPIQSEHFSFYGFAQKVPPQSKRSKFCLKDKNLILNSYKSYYNTPRNKKVIEC